MKKEFAMLVIAPLSMLVLLLLMYFFLIPVPALGPVRLKVSANAAAKITYQGKDYYLRYNSLAKEPISLCHDKGCRRTLYSISCSVHEKCEIGPFYILPLYERGNELEANIESSAMRRRSLGDATNATVVEVIGNVF